MTCKQTISVEFEDKGQDFLTWVIEWSEKKQVGCVIECLPFQSSIWVGTKVLNYPFLGGKLIFRGTTFDDDQPSLKLKYKIVSIEILGVDND